MDRFKIDAENSLRYKLVSPTRQNAFTWVFLNALTGDAGHWTPDVTSALEAQGHGTLVLNYRGQRGTDFAANSPITLEVIESDLHALLSFLELSRPVFVGLSAGGLLAAKAFSSGAETLGIVLVNSLRKPGPRLEWVNRSLAQAALMGGSQLVTDLYLPLLLNKTALPAALPNAFPREGYQPIDPNSGIYNLLSSAQASDWRFDWSSLGLPVLAVCGQEDQLFHDEEEVTELVETLQDGMRVDIPRCGHLIPLERSGKLIDAMLRFAGEKL